LGFFFLALWESVERRGVLPVTELGFKMGGKGRKGESNPLPSNRNLGGGKSYALLVFHHLSQ